MIDDSGELDFNKQSRSQAWAALALTELWEVTGIERYRERARSLLRAEIVDEQSLRGALYPCAAARLGGRAWRRCQARGSHLAQRLRC